MSYSSSSIHLNQQKYAKDLISWCNLQDKKYGNAPMNAPMSANKLLSKYYDAVLEDPIEYQSVVRSFQYFIFTRPKISFVVNILCQFMSQPTNYLWIVVKRFWKYLNGTLNHGLLMTPFTTIELVDFTDVDWGSCIYDKKSTITFFVLIGDNLISWKCFK